ncbi:hypothetical protein [Nocardia sp. NPDC057668]|uniref:hypothetical protein n=1 Tax=Nocardia sp. NPDC057668 TaxID=3346202 RepID=UPI00366D0FC2
MNEDREYSAALGIGDVGERVAAFRRLAVERTDTSTRYYDDEPAFYQARALLEIVRQGLAEDDPGAAKELLSDAHRLIRTFDDSVDRSSGFHEFRQLWARVEGKDPRGPRIDWENLVESRYYRPAVRGAGRESATGELIAEIGAGHQLFGLALEVVAYGPDYDDVVVRVGEVGGADVRYVIVHLTYNLRPEPPPWPAVVDDVTFQGHW